MESDNEEMHNLLEMRKRLIRQMKNAKASNTKLKKKNKNLKSQNVNSHNHNKYLEQENEKLQKLMSTVCGKVCSSIPKVADRLLNYISQGASQSFDEAVEPMPGTSQISFPAFDEPSVNNENLNAESKDGDSVINCGGNSNANSVESDQDRSDSEKQSISDSATDN